MHNEEPKPIVRWLHVMVAIIVIALFIFTQINESNSPERAAQEQREFEGQVPTPPGSVDIRNDYDYYSKPSTEGDSGARRQRPTPPP